MPVDETLTHTPRISARSKEIVKQQRANNKQYSLPPHERLYKFERKSLYTIEDVKENNKNGTKIAGTPSQKHCKRTIKEIQEHVNSLFEFERRKQESLSEMRKLSAALEINNHDVAKEIAMLCASASASASASPSIKSAMRNAVIEKEALQLPNSLYVDNEEVTNRLYKPTNRVCSTSHNKENLEVAACNKCNCKKENVEPSTRKSTSRSVENKTEECEIQTYIEGESKARKEHSERLANRSRIRHLLNWFMYFAKNDVLNLDTLKEYEGEYKNVATCLTKELKKINSSCIDWSRDNFAHSICSNKYTISLMALLTGTAPKHGKVSYDNDDNDDHHNDKNEMKKNKTVMINRSNNCNSMQGVEKRINCLSTKNRREKQENITNIITTTTKSNNNDNLYIEPSASHQSQVYTVTDDATQDDEVNVKTHLTRGRRVDENTFTRLYCKARETQLIEQLRALEEQRLILRREQRRVESNSHWLEEYRKRSLLVKNATVGSAQIDIIGEMENNESEEAKMKCVNVNEKDSNKDKITCMGNDTSIEEEVASCENVELDETNVHDKQKVTISEQENNLYVDCTDAKNSESSSQFKSSSYISNSVHSEEDRLQEIESDQNYITNERILEQNSELMENECITGNHLVHTNTNNTQNNDTLTSAMFRLEEILANNNKENELKEIVEVNNNELRLIIKEYNIKNNSNNSSNNSDYNNNYNTYNNGLSTVEKLIDINLEEEKWCNNEFTCRTSEVSFMQSEELSACSYAQKKLEEPIVYFDLLLDCATCTDASRVNSTQHRYVSERNKAKLHKLALEYYNQLTKKIKPNNK